MDDEEMFINARIIAASEGSKPILSVVTCNMCGSLVVDTDRHSDFHLYHKYWNDGVGFRSQY